MGFPPAQTASPFPSPQHPKLWNLCCFLRFNPSSFPVKLKQHKTHFQNDSPMLSPDAALPGMGSDLSCSSRGRCSEAGSVRIPHPHLPGWVLCRAAHSKNSAGTKPKAEPKAGSKVEPKTGPKAEPKAGLWVLFLEDWMLLPCASLDGARD